MRKEKKGDKKMKKRALCILLALALVCPRGGWAGQDALAPESLFVAGRAPGPEQATPRVEFLCNGKMRTIADKKVHALIRQGHHPFLAAVLVNKQIESAQKAAIVLSRALDNTAYLYAVSFSCRTLRQAAEFFDLPENVFAQLLGIPLDDDHLRRVRRAVYEVMILNPRKQFVDTANPSDATVNQFLNAQIAGVDALVYHFFTQRAEKMTADTGKSREEIVQELVRALPDLIYCVKFAPELYQYFTALQGKWQIPVEEVLEAYRASLSPSERRFSQAVEAQGACTMARIVEMALYDAKDGYYMRRRMAPLIGREKEHGEFVTMPHEFREFGVGVTLAIFRQWQTLGRPRTFEIVEMGAGEGHLAKSVLESIRENARSLGGEWKDFAGSVRYKVVEISKERIRNQQKMLKEFQSDITWVHQSVSALSKSFGPQSVCGVFLSNELPDAFPVHKVKCIDGQLKEIVAVSKDGIFSERATEPSTPLLEGHLKRRGVQLVEGEERTINLMADQWFQDMAQALSKGTIMILDYGASTEGNRAMRDVVSPFLVGGRVMRERRDSYNGGYLMPYNDAVRAAAEKTAGADTEMIVSLWGAALEMFSSPFWHMGQCDITTKADFEAFFNDSPGLGLAQLEYDTQGRFFKKIFQDFSSDLGEGQTADPELFEISPNFKVQTFLKTGTAGTAHGPAGMGALHLLLSKRRIQNADDLRLFLDFVEEKDIAGLSRLVRCLKEESVRRGVPLVGVSSDCLIYLCFLPNVIVQRRGAQTYRDPQKVPPIIIFPAGISLDFAARCLAQNVPGLSVEDPLLLADAPRVVQELSQATSFAEMINCQCVLLGMDEALCSRAFAKCAVDLDRQGYPYPREGEWKNLQELVLMHPSEISRLVMTREPARSIFQVNALAETMKLLLRKGPDPKVLGREYYLEEEETHAGRENFFHWQKMGYVLISLAAAFVNMPVQQFADGYLEPWMREFLPAAAVREIDAMMAGRYPGDDAQASRIKENLLFALIQVLDKMMPLRGRCQPLSAGFSDGARGSAAAEGSL